MVERCCTAGKPGGKQRKQTSTYSIGRNRSTRLKLSNLLTGGDGTFFLNVFLNLIGPFSIEIPFRQRARIPALPDHLFAPPSHRPHGLPKVPVRREGPFPADSCQAFNGFPAPSDYNLSPCGQSGPFSHFSWENGGKYGIVSYCLLCIFT
jgi:hypothetical protein